MKYLLCALIACAIVTVSLAGVYIADNWNVLRNPDSVRMSALKKFPPGTPKSTVLAELSRKKFPYRKHTLRPRFLNDGKTELIEKLPIIELWQECYVPPFSNACVQIFFGFTKDQTLDDIWVRRTADSL